jgi:hypothetical protein
MAMENWAMAIGHLTPSLIAFTRFHLHAGGVGPIPRKTFRSPSMVRVTGNTDLPSLHHHYDLSQQPCLPDFYYDYTLGLLCLSLVAYATLGHAVFLAETGDGKGSATRVVAAWLAGALFNLANVLLIEGIRMAGLSVAFPVGTYSHSIGAVIIAAIVILSLKLLRAQ